MRRASALLFLSIIAGCTPVRYQAAPVELGRYPATRLATMIRQPQGVTWLVPDLLEFALAHNPQVTEAEAKYRTARAAAAVSRQGPSANLTLTAEYSKEAGGSSPWLFGFGTDLPIDRGVRREVRLTHADLAALQARYDLGEALWTARMAVTRAYCDLVWSRQEELLAQEAVHLRRERLARFDRRVSAGEDARPTALLAQTELFAAERRQADAKSRKSQAELAMAEALGVNPASIPALVLGRPTPPTTAARPEWSAQAALTRRDVLRAIADYDIAEGSLKLEIARQFPEVRVGPGYTWERGVTKLPFNLSLTLPPGDLNRAAIRQAEARREEAGLTLEALQAAIVATAEQAGAALAAARTKEERARTVDLPTAQALAARQARAVDAGELDRTDQLAAQAAASDAALALLDAQRAVDVAAGSLEDALRRPLDPKEDALLRSMADDGAHL